MPKKGEIVREYKVIEKIVVGKSVFVVSKISNEKMKFVMKVLEGGVMNDEVKIGMTLWKQCPHLVRIFEVFAGDVDDDELYLIMEYCEEGDLWKRIQKKQPPTDMEIYQFVYEGAMAIQTLHKNNVIHRDIKPGNFYLVKNGGFKLGDYGVARILSSIHSNITMTRTGTEGYVSPEILTGEKAYTNKTDIFSFGITLLEFIIGQHPFSNSNGTINTQSILSGSPIKAALTHPHPCAQLALQMIRVDPANRPSAEDILAAGLPLLAPLHGLSGACQTLRESQATAEERAAAAEKKAETLEKENAALRAEMQRLKGTNNVPAPAPALTQALTVVPTASAAAIENVPFNFLQFCLECYTDREQARLENEGPDMFLY